MKTVLGLTQNALGFVKNSLKILMYSRVHCGFSLVFASPSIVYRKFYLFKSVLTTVILVVSVATHAATEVIQLQNRPASELLPVLQPIVSEYGGVSADGFNLLVNAPEAQLEEIKSIVQQLDKARARLQISVKRADASENMDAQGVGDAAVYTTTDSDDRGRAQSVAVLDGDSAFIGTSEARPYVKSYTDYPGYDHTATEYKSAKSGIYVTPHLLGDEVQLKIKQEQAAFAQGTSQNVNSQAFETTMRVPLGRWVQVGGINERSQTERRRVLYTTQSKGQANRDLFIKVDVLSAQ